jgi:hypothetical protein
MGHENAQKGKEGHVEIKPKKIGKHPSPRFGPNVSLAQPDLENRG